MAAFLFNHPGGEHVPKEGACEYAWNTKSGHKRKFLITDACVAERDGKGFRRSDETKQVGFWGEWEPPSACCRFDNEDDEPLLPMAWHGPLLGRLPPGGAQNTDPWVFNETMRYSNCGQRFHAMRELEAGDIVFFGSVMKRGQDGSRTGDWHFFLDTVFVVDGAQPYTIRNSRPVLPEGVDDLFSRHVAEPLGRQVGTGDFILYSGTMLTSAPSTSFSYVPCRPVEGDNSTARFARPMIDQLFDISVSNPQTRFWRLDCPAEKAWQAVTEQCLAQRLELAVRVPL